MKNTIWSFIALFMSSLCISHSFAQGPRAETDGSSGPHGPRQPLAQISVFGKCEREISADRVSQVFTVIVQKSSLKEAQLEATKLFSSLQKKFSALKLAGYQSETTEASTSEWREWEANVSTLKGYIVRLGTKVTASDLDRFSELQSAAVALEKIEVGQLLSFLSLERKRKEERECLADAVSDAKLKSQSLLSTTGKKLGSIVELTELGSQDDSISGSPMVRGAMMMADKSSASDGNALIISPRLISLSVSVRVTHQLLE